MPENERNYAYKLDDISLEAGILCEEIFGPESFERDFDGHTAIEFVQEAFKALPSTESNEVKASLLINSTYSRYPQTSFLGQIARVVGSGVYIEGWKNPEKRALLEAAIIADYRIYDSVFDAEGRGQHYFGTQAVGLIEHVRALTGYPTEEAIESLGKIRTYREGLLTLKDKLRAPANSARARRR